MGLGSTGIRILVPFMNIFRRHSSKEQHWHRRAVQLKWHVQARLCALVVSQLVCAAHFLECKHATLCDGPSKGPVCNGWCSWTTWTTWTRLAPLWTCLPHTQWQSISGWAMPFQSHKHGLCNPFPSLLFRIIIAPLRFLILHPSPLRSLPALLSLHSQLLSHRSSSRVDSSFLTLQTWRPLKENQLEQDQARTTPGRVLTQSFSTQC